MSQCHLPPGPRSDEEVREDDAVLEPPAGALMPPRLPDMIAFWCNDDLKS